MRNRWYDSLPTVSMAVSLLQNTEPEYREMTTRYFTNKVNQLDPSLPARLQKEPTGIWGFIQKRKSMDEASWVLVESLRYLPEEKMTALAGEMIHYIYQLEHADSVSLGFDSTRMLQAAL